MSEQSTTLRRYAPHDAAATLRCFQRAVRETASRDYDPSQIASWAPSDVDVDKWGSRRATAETWIAERDGQVVGFADVGADGYIDMMFVDPDAARSGVASALLRHLVSLVRSRGGAQLNVNASITARPLFEHHGFTVAAEQRVERNGSVLTNYRMLRDLGR